MSAKKVKILFIGGLGFIGVNFCLRFQDRFDITIIDAQLEGTGYHEIHKGLLYNCKIYLGDYVKVNDLEALVSEATHIFHFAGPGAHLAAEQNPLSDIDENIIKTVFLLETIRKLPTKPKLIFASTRQVYGNVAEIPVDESAQINPIDINGISKYAAESYIMHYARVHQLQTTTLRITNVYGPHMYITDARLNFIGFWIGETLRKKPIKIYDPQLVRDFIYIDDLTSFMGLLIKFDDWSPTYNLGNSTAVSFENLGMIFREKFGADVVVEAYPEELRDIQLKAYTTNSALARNDFGWECRIDLLEGLSLTFEACKMDFDNEA